MRSCKSITLRKIHKTKLISRVFSLLPPPSTQPASVHGPDLIKRGPSNCTALYFSLYSSTVPYTTMHCTTLHYTSVHYTQLNYIVYTVYSAEQCQHLIEDGCALPLLLSPAGSELRSTHYFKDLYTWHNTLLSAHYKKVNTLESTVYVYGMCYAHYWTWDVLKVICRLY